MSKNNINLFHNSLFSDGFYAGLLFSKEHPEATEILLDETEGTPEYIKQPKQLLKSMKAKLKKQQSQSNVVDVEIVTNDRGGYSIRFQGESHSADIGNHPTFGDARCFASLNHWNVINKPIK